MTGNITRFLLLIILPFSLEAHPAAWTLDKGEKFLINNFSYYKTDDFYDLSGNKIKTAGFTKFEYNPYFEYGWQEGLTAGFSARAVQAENKDAAQKSFALDYTELFLKKKFYDDGRTVFSVQPLIKIPGFYGKENENLFGQRQLDFELRFLAGHNFNFYEMNNFLNLEAAFRKRLSEASDEIRFDATLGIKPVERLTILSQAFTIFATEKPDFDSFIFSGSGGYNLVKIQMSGVYDYNEDISVQLGISHNIWAENTGGGSSLIFSVWRKF